MFRFKRFTVEDDRSSMKVGTDGVLLGAWVGVDGAQANILDIGTGSGLIALMLAQRSGESMIDAVDISEASVEQAADNFHGSEWRDRLFAIHSDINNFESSKRYDLIVSNPPYFVDSLTSPDSGRTIARHTTELTFRELIDSVVRLLDINGRFALILPTVESALFDEESCGRLSLVRRCVVYGRDNLPAKRYMSEYRLVGGVDVREESIVIEGDRRGDYSEDYKALTRDFYLKF